MRNYFEKFPVFRFLFSVEQPPRLLRSEKLTVGRALPAIITLPSFMIYGWAKGP